MATSSFFYGGSTPPMPDTLAALANAMANKVSAADAAATAAQYTDAALLGYFTKAAADARFAALVHTHVAADISDSTAAGRTLLTAASAAAQRTALGLGNAATWSVGTTAGTLAAGNDSRLSDARTPVAHNQTASTISDSTAAGRALLTAADAAAQRLALALGTMALQSSTAYVGQDTATGAAAVPSGTTAQRPAGAMGKFRFNADLGKFEGHNGTSWGSVGGGATGGGSDAVFVENDQAVTQNYSITAGKNAMSAGPITINNGVVVTIPTGSVWTIV